MCVCVCHTYVCALCFVFVEISERFLFFNQDLRVSGLIDFSCLLAGVSGEERSELEQLTELSDHVTEGHKSFGAHTLGLVIHRYLSVEVCTLTQSLIQTLTKPQVTVNDPKYTKLMTQKIPELKLPSFQFRTP